MLTAPAETASRPMPTWVSIPIILLCLVGGGWIIHWYVMTDPLSHEAKILGDPPTQAQWQNSWPGQGGGGPNGPGGRGRNNGNFNNGNFNNPNQRRFVRDRGDGRWEMRTEQARLDVTFANGKLNWHVITYMGNYSFVPDEAKNTIYSARSLAGDEKRTANLKLTTDQVKKLKGLSSTINMDISEADKNQLGAEVIAYIQGDKGPAQEAKVLAELDAVAQKSIPATRQQATERAAQINSIITPEMWKQDAAAGGAAPK